MKNNKFRITIIFQILFFYNNIFAQNYADSLSFYYQKKDFNKSIYFGEKWLFDLKKANDTVSLNYADCLFFNANSQQDNPNTETYYLESLSLYKKILGNNNEYSNYLYIVSNYFLNNKKDFFKAEYFFKELINIRGRNLGTKNKDYIEALFMLGFTYYQKEDFNSALQIFSTVANLRKENFGENNTDYLKALNFVGLAYQNLKDLSLAEKVFLDVYEINKKLKGENDMSNLTYLANLVSIYDSKEDFLLKENYCLKSLEITQITFGTNSINYASQINNLAIIYQRKGDYKKAENLFISSLEIKKIVLEETDPSYLASLNNLGLLYAEKGDFFKAEPIYLEVIEKLKNKKNSSEYAATLTNLGNLYNDLSNFPKAEVCLLEANQIYKDIFGEEDSNYAISFNNLASLYEDMGDYKQAEKCYNQVLIIQEKKTGINNSEYVITLNNLGNFYRKKGDYLNSEKTLLNCLEIEKNVIGNDHAGYLSSLNNLASLYLEQEKYLKCEELLLEIINKRKKIFGEYHPDYLTSLINLANLYNKIGENRKAEQIYTEILKKEDVILKKNSVYYATVMNNIGAFYMEKGNLKNAEFYLEKSRSIRENILGVNHLEYSYSLNNLAMLYGKLNNGIKKEEYLLKALDIKKNILGENHSDYALVLSNLAVYYLEKDEFIKAEPLLIKNIDIIRNNYGKFNLTYASAISNLASLKNKRGNYDEAEELFLDALEISRKILGENNKQYLSTLSNLSTFYQKLKDFKNAEYYGELVLEKRKKTLGQFHSDTNISVSNMLALYSTINNFNKIKLLSNESLTYFKKEIESSKTFLSENEINLFTKKNINELFFLFSFLQNYPTQYSEINIGCYENELLVKNLSLRNQQRIKTSIEKSGDITVKEKYQQFINNKRYLTKLNELPIAQRPKEYDQLKTDTENLEKELTRISSTFADSKKSLSISWKQIQDNLKPNEIAIDLVAYDYYNKKWTDSIVYAAFVVKKGFKAPKYIPLFEQKQLEFLLAKNKNEKNDTKIDNQYSDKAISDLFLKPLEKELDEISTLYLSPSGLGHQINFSALPVSETQTLGEKYSVHILGSTAEIVNYKTGSLNPKMNLELMLYGNIDYNKSDATNKLISDTLATNNVEFTVLTDRSSVANKFEYLAGSKIEINKINALAQQNNFTSVIIDDKKATEESIKALDGRTTPFVLHLATHGFFFPDPKQELPKEHLLSDSKSELFKTDEDPMMRSGLLFSGANKYWGKGIENLTTEDGILTASEISNLDLSACQLVVLSACETGLGDINGSEGVFGLQRAFKMAGVKNIIMSLWKVQDVQTAELFDVFYRECFAGKTIHDAFQTAQAKMKVKYSPYYWAGFLLLE